MTKETAVKKPSLLNIETPAPINRRGTYKTHGPITKGNFILNSGKVRK